MSFVRTLKEEQVMRYWGTLLTVLVTSIGLSSAVLAQETPQCSEDQMGQAQPGIQQDEQGGRKHKQAGDGRRGGGQNQARKQMRRQQIMQRFDANGDGMLDEAEKAQVRAAKQARRQQRMLKQQQRQQQVLAPALQT